MRGSEGQERPGFRSDYQALLSVGIGVLAPNVRGSSGFGKKFVNLDNGELRFNGTKDIKSCVDYLVSNRLADPRRIGITGGSYGGCRDLDHRVRRAGDAEGPARKALAARQARSHPCGDDGAARHQRYERAGGGGGADRQASQVAERAGGVRPLPGRGHGWRKIPNRIRSTVEMVRFFDQHLNARAKTSSQQ